MSTSPKKHHGGDPLGVERTALANERTLLAYTRTALAFLITGSTALHFMDQPEYRIAGFASLAVGVVTGVGGFIRFLQVRQQIRNIEEEEERFETESDED